MTTPKQEEPEAKGIEFSVGALVLGWLLAALIFFFVWNVGVIALVAACGGHVGQIGYIACLFIVPIVGWATRLVRR